MSEALLPNGYWEGVADAVAPKALLPNLASGVEQDSPESTPLDSLTNHSDPK
jgi:hypothetical protein